MNGRSGHHFHCQGWLDHPDEKTHHEMAEGEVAGPWQQGWETHAVQRNLWQKYQGVCVSVWSDPLLSEITNRLRNTQGKYFLPKIYTYEMKIVKVVPGDAGGYRCEVTAKDKCDSSVFEVTVECEWKRTLVRWCRFHSNWCFYLIQASFAFSASSLVTAAQQEVQQGDILSAFKRAYVHWDLCFSVEYLHMCKYSRGKMHVDYL